MEKWAKDAPFISGFIVDKIVVTNGGMYLCEVVQNFRNGESSMFQNEDSSKEKIEKNGADSVAAA